MFEFYRATEWPFATSIASRPKRRIKRHTTDKKRGGDVDELEEYIHRDTKELVFDAISPTVRPFYPEVDWEA